MTISIPQLSLVVLIGPSSSGKSTFARRHFLPTEIIASDACRAMIADDENDLEVTPQAFALAHSIVAERLAYGRLAVFDATNVRAEDRAPLVALARKYHLFPIAVVFDLPTDICMERHRGRTDRSGDGRFIVRQRATMRRDLRRLEREGFRRVVVLDSPEKIDAATIVREPLWNDRRELTGPFDIIGDVHGCADELEELLERLGYLREPVTPERWTLYPWSWHHPEGRTALFVGDLADRGPRVLDTFELVRNMIDRGSAMAVPGNHDIKVLKALQGRNVQVKHGLEQTLAELDALPAERSEEYRSGLARFIDGLVSHLVLDGGNLVVAHAGMKAEMQGRSSGAVRTFALFGETTGETDEFGLPVRYDWASGYRGRAHVVYGHTPVPQAEWLNRTINIDTGCVFGGALTALRWPERELAAVAARRVYSEPVRPIASRRSVAADDARAGVLEWGRLSGKRLIETRLMGRQSIPAENVAAALETLSRFAIDPRWLVYLPPTMAPTETSALPDLLEHPEQAFEQYRRDGVSQVVCEEKHMGSRAAVAVTRDREAAARRFGVEDGRTGHIWTRTGRPFFNDDAQTDALLERLRGNLDATGFWESFNSDWALLDAELMPWSAKAMSLIENQYAPVGTAGRLMLAAAERELAVAGERGLDVAELAATAVERAAALDHYSDAYRRYCWSVGSLDDLRLAPFHLLATEGGVHVDRTNLWHMETLARHAVSAGEPTVMATRHMTVSLNDEGSVREGIEWWETLTAAGGEGMVVKPIDFVVRGSKGLAQPAIKCRGREYLRIIYGPEYTLHHNLERLRRRSLGTKRMLALREFAIGVEGLERFVARESLERVHECALGVLALESEPVDPRL